ncbi:hypothetical protein PN498_15525 [Oscillatoria sp. CS-180]|uniref:hypothetical protein n=1 Tax=Oscillatoria sp. CS-180 TaxID=3021720 RepID=UPI002330D41F|nr:hypothetical protein [Oscillatoria sp. CS-180]MDB9527408.1 hypothetical protein [Oscillatoria sp. CS-180]
MANLGRYCKAYPVKMLRKYASWIEKSENLNPNRVAVENVEKSSSLADLKLKDDDFLYLQQDHTVTDGIYLNEYVIFQDVTNDWLTFCKQILEFEVPDYATSDVDATATDVPEKLETISEESSSETTMTAAGVE